ncbi:hypothetical protein AAFF_G00204830 [Aldrovandia affinis]|uniref:Uncharacterized protein n=1 Tax=Aldrovandia affinis TaxID=143900 RepID=A0AAD7W5F9_9TELE|nr:hypothetical protein AAFF_G00204830 [Aldrovandia affinis]
MTCNPSAYSSLTRLGSLCLRCRLPSCPDAPISAQLALRPLYPRPMTRAHPLCTAVPLVFFTDSLHTFQMSSNQPRLGPPAKTVAPPADRRSLTRPKSFVSTRLLSLEEAQARTQAPLLLQGGPLSFQGKFHTVLDLPVDR